MCEDKPPSKNITTLHSYHTEYNADSVEWCPHEPFQNFFVCANYQLIESTEEAPSKRVGCILLFSVAADCLKLHQSIHTAAVLDQKWCHNRINDRSILGVVNAEKTLEIYAFNPESTELEVVTRYTIEDDESERLLLSLDWSTGKYQSNEPEIVCSDSRGNIHRFKLENDKLAKCDSCHGHDFEAWIAGFYYWNPDITFSGGDDCCFLKFDKRVGLEPISRNRIHEAGVTSMHSRSSKEYVLATGSYDANVRMWDIRFMKNCTNTIKMPGTLWRLKWDPFDNTKLLAACMLGGVHITDSPDSDLQIIDSYYEHENISYGADWSYLPVNTHGGALIATCSFYDKLLCVSKLKTDQ